MLHAGLDLSRKRVDVCVISDDGELIARTAAPPDSDGLARTWLESSKATSSRSRAWSSR